MGGTLAAAWRGVAVLTLGAASVSAGCRHPARVAPAPAAAAAAAAAAEETYCWQAVFHTVLPPDTVAAHFARAFTHLGLTGATWSHQADTAWASAGPTILGGPRGGGMYAARVLAYRHGDTTRFRHFVAVTPPAQGWPPPLDTLNPVAFHIGFCGDLGTAAAVHGTAPQWPNGEEMLPVWAGHPLPGMR